MNRNFRWHILVGLACLFATGGCVCSQRNPTSDTTRLLKRNMTAVHDLALLFKLNGEYHQDSTYPRSLSGLADQLREAGIVPSIPQCLCPDGKMRDFQMVSGLGMIEEDSNLVFLSSPREMTTELTIVAYLSGRTAILDSKEAAAEIERSRQWLKQSK